MSDNSHSPMLNLRDRFTVAYAFFLLGLALLLRLPNLFRGLTEDELNTVIYVVRLPSTWEIMSRAHVFNNHIAYSLAARLTDTVISGSEWSLRLPALVFGILGIYAVWALAAYLRNTRAALIPPALLCLSPVHVEWSTSARGYSAMMFFTVVAIHSYFLILDRWSRARAITLIAASTLGIYFHLYSAAVTGVQWIFSASILRGHAAPGLVRRSATKLVFQIFPAVALISTLLYAPVLLSLGTTLIGRGQSEFQPRLPLEVLEMLGGYASLPLLLFLLGFVAIGWARLRSERLEVSRFLIVLTLLPFSVAWVARPFDLYARFFTFLLPPFVLLLAFGIGSLWLAALRRPGHYAVCVVVLLVSGATAASWTHAAFQPWEDGYRDASRLAQSGAPEAVGLCAIGADTRAWQYYFERSLYVPETVQDLLNFSRAFKEVRCVYYDAPWQGESQRAIAEYLTRHGKRVRVKYRDVIIFRPGLSDISRDAAAAPGSPP